MSASTALEGTWEQVKQHDRELVGKRVRLIVLPVPKVPVPRARTVPATTGRGMLSFLPEGSEEFAASKRQEIERE